MLEFNKYVRLYHYEEHTLVYNTINGKILIFPKGMIKGNIIIGNISYNIEKKLYEQYFLDRVLPWDKFENRFESNSCLLISLETFLACNLSCPYCYQQNNKHPKSKISNHNLDTLYNYIVGVYKLSNFDNLILKILGGEPSLDWEPADYLIKKIKPFCDEHNIKLHLRVDTNCTNIRPFLSVREYDSILFTIPLCNREQHNKYRHYVGGFGTYDDIVDNIKQLERIQNSHVVLRHNTDATNILYFDKYLEDISRIGLCKHVIKPQYTNNPILGEYVNKLTYQQYVDWLSTDCIESMVRHGFKVNIAPTLTLNGKCQQNSEYSIKMFSDGKVGACAAHFFDKTNPYLSDIMKNNISSIKNYWGGIKNKKLFHNERCLNCSSFFTCSGHYMLPCVKGFNITPCKPEENLYLNWSLYFNTIYKHILFGNVDNFPCLDINYIL